MPAPAPALAGRLFQPPPPLVGRFFGPDGRVETIAARRPVPEAIPVVIGPRGTGASDPVRIDASLASTWILANPFGRVPMVQVFVGDEPVLTDVQADPAHITVTFPTPQQGFVLAS